jgi:uncharacterized protein YecT (DUF1311 family)
MKHTACLAALAITALFPVCAVRAAGSDPIAAEAQTCLDSPQGQTTAGMTECSRHAYQAYDRQLNQVYHRVLKAADPKSRELIRDAQRKWLAWRMAEQAAQNGPWRSGRGSMASPDIEALNVNAIRARITELQYYAN